MHLRILLSALTATAVALAAPVPPAAADTYRVTLDPSARQEPADGRLILFFVTETGGRWEHIAPVTGPFWERPQPIASVAVSGLEPGGWVTIDGAAIAFPTSLDLLDGPVRVQAILDVDNTERSHLEGPGNLLSDVVTTKLDAKAEDFVSLTLKRTVRPRRLSAERDNLKWIEFRSDSLSRFYGRDVFHRAGVALPQGYLDPDAVRAHWPAIYIVPSFGGRHSDAARLARRLERPGGSLPDAVHIVLDPESPLGHHGFVDSVNHGPRGAALVSELIPHLESKFRLVARPEARIVTGHSSGGWSALWLQLNWREVFGGCWASSPDPIDFTAFQMANLYENANLYVDEQGELVPSYRVLTGPDGGTAVRMTVREECLMEHAMNPNGGSGEQWDTWEAMFSPKDPSSGYPEPLFDARTGAIHRKVVAHWSRFDITKQVTENWELLGPIVTDRVRLICGSVDSFYLNRAVERFREKIALQRGSEDGAGYVELVEGADHHTVVRAIHARWRREMIEHLRNHELHD